jgi:hypothetical protein
MTPDEFRRLVDVEGDGIALVRASDIFAAADAWENDRSALGMLDRQLRDMGKRLEEAEKALRDVLDGMEASGGWEGDDEVFAAGMAALAGEEKP